MRHDCKGIADDNNFLNFFSFNSIIHSKVRVCQNDIYMVCKEIKKILVVYTRGMGNVELIVVKRFEKKYKLYNH